MKYAKKTLTALVCSMTLIVGGCGEAPITLTPEEESAIVYYAAHVVSKYNTRQPDGLVLVQPDELEEDTEIKSEPAGTELSTEDSSSETEAQGDVMTSLTDSLGLTDITAEYIGEELVSAESPGAYSALNMKSGCVYLVITIALHNPTEHEVECDMLSKQLAISVIVNETISAPALMTLLPEDLGIYDETIASGETVNTVLVFEFPDSLTQVNSPKLKINHGGVVKQTGM